MILKILLGIVVGGAAGLGISHLFRAIGSS
jgi:hypothetical protein